MNTEPLRFFTPILAVLSVILLIAVGQGISGIWIVAYFVLLVVATFAATYLKYAQEKKQGIEKKTRFVKFGFEAESLLMVLALLVWITLLDFFIVETFKLLNYAFAENTYWLILFGGIVPIAVLVMALAYYIGSQHMSNALRLVILSIFFFHSNILDLLYYKLFSEPFPDQWTWLYQPRFAFGDVLDTRQVAVWAVVAVIMGIVSFILPYENFTPDKYDLRHDERLPKANKRMNIVLVVVFALFAAGYGVIMIEHIKDSLRIHRETLYGFENEVSDFEVRDSDFPSTLSFDDRALVRKRFTIAKESIDTLNAEYKAKGAYPKSEGNCQQDWDSSFKSLPFTVDGKQVEDPADKAVDCAISRDSSNIWYYSDGNSFALVLSGVNVPSTDEENLYIPGERDVQWFNKDVQFSRDWRWDTGVPLLVFMYEKGNEVTKFE